MNEMNETNEINELFTIDNLDHYLNQSMRYKHVQISNYVDFVKLIVQCPEIQTLNLTDNQMGNAGTKLLSEVLKFNSTLTTLDLSENRIGDSGVQSLIESLKINSTLTTLNFSKFNILETHLISINSYLLRNRNQSIESHK